MANGRDFDIVLWGATSFVGQRAAHHLASRLSSRGDVRWAIAGRNSAKLEALRAQLGAAAKVVPIIIADAHDVSSLDDFITRTRVVCSTVGPYAKYGSELVEACARAGTHYCDLSAELHWMRKMMEAHQAKAQQTGARIVHACGFDSIPSDIGVFFLQREAKRLHETPCSHIKMRVLAMRGGFSGGTVATFLHVIEQGPWDPAIQRCMVEPYSLNPEGQRLGPDRPEKMMAIKIGYDEDLNAWTMPFFMGPMNTKIVRRTNALLDYPYGRDFRYEEAILTGSGALGWLKAAIGALAAGGFMAAMSYSLTRRLLKRYVLPEPGRGPSEEVLEKGYFKLTLVGKRLGGGIMRARVSGAGDPGVESTSRMLIESALCLAEDSGQISVGGGFWTPASALGDPLLSRLCSHAGLSFELD